MNTLNPLFLDSTKPIGDKVVTDVELSDVLLRDGESLLFEVIDSLGSTLKFELREIKTKKSTKFKVEAWLKHESPIQYRFVIESRGQLLFSSALCESWPGHSITKKWEPCFQNTPQPTKAEKMVPDPLGTSRSSKSNRESKSKAAKDPLNPQLFDQIKFLLDDLL